MVHITVSLSRQTIQIAQLQADKERLEAILMSIGDAVVAADLEGRIMMMNPVAETLTGWNAGDASGMPLNEVLPIIDYKSGRPLNDPFGKVLHQRLSTGLKRDSQLVCRDGKKHFISACASPIIEAGQSVSGTVIVFREIDRLRKTEDEIRRLSSIVEQSAISVAIIDVSGIIEYINPRFMQFISCEKHDLIGKSLFSPVLADIMPLNLDGIRDTVRNRGEWNGEVYFCNRQGKPCWGSLHCAPVRDEDYTISNYFVIIQDTTARKLVEEQLKRAKEEAEVANHAKAEFLANMSHEIRTPLNAIIGMTRLSLLSNLNQDQKENLEIIKLAGDTLLRIIDDILDFSKIEAGKLRMEKINFNIRDLVEKSIAIHSPRAQEKGLAITVCIDETIPVMVNGDPYRIEQVLANLLSNAVKFTETGEVNVDLEYQGESADGIMIQFSVADSGIGIEQAEQNRIFDSFYQADSSISRTFGGTGLGLNISKNLVKMMGGSIGVRSTPGKGSTFFFTVELGYASSSVQEAIPSGVPGQGEASAPLSILVVEDNQVNQLVVSNLLRAQGHRVETAENGLEALALLANNRYDLILMDILMPEMDGLETTRRIRKDEEKTGIRTPIIALTAYAVYGVREKFLAAGMNDYLAKPVQMEDLYQTIHKVVHNTRNRKTDYSGIEALTPKDLFLRVDADFLTRLDHSLQQIDLALEAGDPTQAEKWAQQVKELAYQMDEQNIRVLAFKIQLLARKGDLSNCRLYWEKLRNQYNHLISLGS